VLLALRQAIDEYDKEGGLPARKARYIKNHEILVSGLEKLGIHSIVAPEDQSYIITTFELGNLDFSKLYAELKSKGFIIYPGKMTSIPTFRLGNIGNVYPEDMAQLIKILGAMRPKSSKKLSGKP
jgi:2-aminoethylphosphonate-pyruvate transaminase